MGARARGDYRVVILAVSRVTVCSLWFLCVSSVASCVLSCRRLRVRRAPLRGAETRIRMKVVDVRLVWPEVAEKENASCAELV